MGPRSAPPWKVDRAPRAARFRSRSLPEPFAEREEDIPDSVAGPAGSGPEYITVLSSRRLRRLTAEALRILGRRDRTARAYAPPEGVARLPADSDAILIHDFAPEPAESVYWLGEVAELNPRLTVYALLDGCVTETLTTFFRLPTRFAFAGVALGAELRPARLARELEDARDAGRWHLLGRVAVERWELDPTLESVVELILRSSVSYTTLERLQEDAGLGRRRLDRLVRDAGFTRSLRFLQALRVLAAVALVQRGYAVRDAAGEVGYGSADTLRRHCGELLDMPPTKAASLPLAEVADRLRRA